MRFKTSVISVPNSNTITDVSIKEITKTTVLFNETFDQGGNATLLLRHSFPSNNIYENIQIQGVLEKNTLSIINSKGWDERAQTFLEYVQSSLPKGNKFLDEHNQQILDLLLSEPQYCWMQISKVGGIISKKIKTGPNKDYFVFTADEILSELIINNSLIDLLFERADATQAIKVKTSVTRIEKKGNSSRVFLKPLSLSHSSQSPLESLKINNTPSFLSELRVFTTNSIKFLRKLVPKQMFLASILPIIVGYKLSSVQPNMNNILTLFILVLAMLCIQAGINLLLEYVNLDHIIHVEKLQTTPLSSSQLIRTQFVSPFYGALIGIALSFTALGLAIYLNTLVQNNLIIIYGIIGAVIAYSYAGKPFELSRKGFGELTVILIFGPLPTVATYLIFSTTELSGWIWAIGFMPGVLTAIQVILNNLSDLDLDEVQHKNTLATILGRTKSTQLLQVLNYGAVFTPVLLSLFGILDVYFVIFLVFLPVLFLHYQQKPIIIINEANWNAKFQSVFALMFLIIPLTEI